MALALAAASAVALAALICLAVSIPALSSAAVASVFERKTRLVGYNLVISLFLFLQNHSWELDADIREGCLLFYQPLEFQVVFRYSIGLFVWFL